MVDFDKSKTKENLARAFAGECQDGARYQFMAKLAMKEGYPYLQSIFKTHAKNEMAHAQRFFDLIVENSKVKQKNIEIHGGYPFTNGDLLSSIKDAMGVEESQSGNVYPEFASTAKEEGYPEIEKAFLFAGSVENCHKLMLEQLYEKLKDGTLYEEADDVKWKCSNCGFEHTDKIAWEICPSCDMPQGYVEVHINMGE